MKTSSASCHDLSGGLHARDKGNRAMLRVRSQSRQKAGRNRELCPCLRDRVILLDRQDRARTENKRGEGLNAYFDCGQCIGRAQNDLDTAGATLGERTYYVDTVSDRLRNDDRQNGDLPDAGVKLLRGHLAAPL